MNTPAPDPFAHEPLTAEERAMAARLARLGPHGEPSPSLDDRIIGAARADAGRRSTRQPRWPALLGLAATLVLAIGVTWQLQPAGESPLAEGQVSEEPTSAPAAEAAAEATMAPAGSTPRRDTLQDVQQTAAPRGNLAKRQSPQAVAVPDVPAEPAAPSPPPPSPAPAPPPAPLAAPPPAPVAAPAQPPLTATRADEEDAAIRAEGGALRRDAQESRARTRARREQVDSAASAAASPMAFPADAARTPAAQDGQLEPEAWIERIRVRYASGDHDSARESLQLLRRTHPQVTVPPDLLERLDAQP